jgi:LemA protein
VETVAKSLRRKLIENIEWRQRLLLATKIISKRKGIMASLIVVLSIAALLAILLVFVITQYNDLVRLKNGTKNSWSQVDVVLRQRYDLIPNLVEVVKGYAAHESETLESVILARNSAIGSSTVTKQVGSENMLSNALGRLFALSEDYPNLKADKNFMELQKELTIIESRIAYARVSYNESVLIFNNKIQMFPSNIIAGIFHFGLGDFFEVEGESAGPVSIQF